jgi:hypothetical protein
VTRTPGQQQQKERSIMKRALVASVLGMFAFALVTIGSDSAYAQKKGAAKPAATDSGAGGRTKNYDFSGDNIEGELIKPDGEMVNTRKFAEHTSLIRVRQDFIKEIVKSADNLN